jgi:murein DD-endopeptidase MepM/ murein hydrolase activator NlpD
VRSGEPLAAVGNTGHTNEPHLHLQIQDSPTGREDAMRTYPVVFRNADVSRGGLWPFGDRGELRTGDVLGAPAR